MMYRFKHQGFSLIELMVVMAIMAIAMGLTGGLVASSIDQQRRQVEVEQVRQLFKRLSYQAFYSGTDITLRTEQSWLEYRQGERHQRLEFDALVFVAEDYLITSKTQVYPQKFGIIQGNSIRNFAIDSIYEEYQQQ